MGIEDIPFIIFGGERHFEDDTRIVLPNAFQIAFSKEHVKAANEKCGYVPSNRIALDSDKLRHELVLDLDGEVDEDSNNTVHSALLLSIEKLNHSIVEKLEKEDFMTANTLKRTVNRTDRSVSDDIESDTNGTVTMPGTTARQQALMKATTAGQFFFATNGGAEMNSENCLLAAEMKCYEKELKELKRRKNNAMSYRKSYQAAKMVVENEKISQDSSKWTTTQIKSMIRWKNSKEATSKLALRQLQILWRDKYTNAKPSETLAKMDSS